VTSVPTRQVCPALGTFGARWHAGVFSSKYECKLAGPIP
jgi:hypothetical protein